MRLSKPSKWIWTCLVISEYSKHRVPVSPDDLKRNGCNWDFFPGCMKRGKSTTEFLLLKKEKSLKIWPIVDPGMDHQHGNCFLSLSKSEDIFFSSQWNCLHLLCSQDAGWRNSCNGGQFLQKMKPAKKVYVAYWPKRKFIFCCDLLWDK